MEKLPLVYDPAEHAKEQRRGGAGEAKVGEHGGWIRAKVDESLGREGEMSVSRREVPQKWIKAEEAADMPAGTEEGGGEGVVIIRPVT